MGKLTIERIGGIAGFGSPGSRIRSRGEIEWDDLPDATKKTIDDLFVGGGDAKNDKAASLRDAFKYRITRAAGKSTESIDVSEPRMPAVLLKTIKDELV